MARRRLKPKYRKILNLLVFLFTLICLSVAIYSIINIINWKKDVDTNDKIQEQLESSAIVVEQVEEEIKYNIDFEALKEVNKDTIAYIKVNGTDIDYVVVKGTDNSYYLNHNFEKKWNVAGWVFADYHNLFDGADKNIVIFGHSMKNGSMFGTLKKTLNKDWYENEENHEIVIVTEMGTYYYQTFSTYSISAEDYYINTKFKDNDEFAKFVKKLKSRSVYDYKVEVSGEDKILTLSSCLAGANKRVVLHAKLVKKKIKLD